MTEQDIALIEKELGVQLPADYRKVVLNYPIRAGYGTADSFLYDDSNALLELNLEYRRGFSGLAPWPAHFFIIGDDGAASCYFLDVTKPQSPVFFADHGNLKDI